MSLSSGARLGPYEITGTLGAGGMGEVYRARDVRLGRDVAVKALSAASRLDADRVARFEREAQVLASLNHPHIAAIYGLEQVPASTGDIAPLQFLILELVEGGTLADRIARGPMPVPEALAVARQVADALHAAHDRGIVHRDLKPGNIALTRDGQAKVLDFGLAKTAASADALTAAGRATESGVVQGTAAYMSPEQLRGQTLDKRTDIWSFGCVLYESLTGRHPFTAATLSDIMAAVLNREPDWAALPSSVPSRVAWLLRRCLEKDVKRRLHDIADARIELDEAIARPSDASASVSTGANDARLRHAARRERIAWIAAGLAALAAVVSFTLGRPASAPTTPAPPLVHAAIVLPQGIRLLVGEDRSARFALSPDGRRLAIVAGPPGQEQLWVRPLDGVRPQPLAGTVGAVHPFWSPDSQSIAFVGRTSPDDLVGSRTQLKRIDLANGQVTTLCEVRLAAAGSWNSDGVILFTPDGTSPIHRIAASGGTPTPVTSLDAAAGEIQHVHPFFLPDGRHFLYAAIGSKTKGATDARGVYLASLDSSEPPALLFEGGTNAKFTAGHVVFVREGRLFASPLDLAGRPLVQTAAPVQLAEGVEESRGGGFAVAGAFSVSNSGLIAYQAVAPVPMQLEWWSRAGQRTKLLGDQADYGDVVLSADGTRAAVSRLDSAVGTHDLWVFDVMRAVPERITSDAADDFAPVWSPDGTAMIFSSTRRGRVDLFRVPVTTGGSEALLPVPGLEVGKFASSWSRDNVLAFVAGGRILGRSDVWTMNVSGEGKPFAFAETPAVETQPKFSPNGKWLLYAANTSGRLEVYIRAASGTGPAERVSINGGNFALWRRDGAEVFFLSPDNRIMAASVREDGASIRVGAIQPLFQIQFRRARLDGYPYAVAPDGQSFLVNTLIEDPAPPTISLLVNWLKG